MCDRTKFQQNRPDGFEDIVIFPFSRWPPSTILDFEIFFNVWFSIWLGGLICIVIPNFIKISRTTAEISHLTFLKRAAVRHLRFFSPLGKPADRAIYFTCVIFFSLFKLSKAISESNRPIFTIFSPNGRYLCECCQSGPFFTIPQGTLPWQPI